MTIMASACSASVRIAAVLCLLVLPFRAAAQKWGAGVTAGGDVNFYNIDTQYQYDWRYKSGNGFTVGVMGQYQVVKWFAARVDLNVAQKNFSQYRTGNAKDNDYSHRNLYLQLPVMGCFSFGGKHVRGFLNLGVYGAYWADSRLKGTIPDAMYNGTLLGTDGAVAEVNQKYDFSSTKDNRFEFGALCGIGVEYRIDKHWMVQAEGRLYYSLTSTTKNYMRIKNPRYNTTIAYQIGCAYNF